jgi:hypothetical protein
MRGWIFILSILLVCCARDEPKQVITIDSAMTADMTSELDTIKYLMLIKTTNTEYRKKIIEQSKLIDKYQLIIRTGQLGEIELMDYKLKIDRLRDSNMILVNKIVILNEQTRIIKDSNIASKKLIQSVCAENVQLHKSLSTKPMQVHNPFLSDVSVKACGFNRNGSIYQTEVAKQVKRMEVRFVVNPNPEDKEKKHLIKTYISQAKDIKGKVRVSTYRQEKFLPILETIDYSSILEPDTYYIKITVDEDQVFMSTLTLK